MIDDKSIMRFETQLPDDFDGTFRFTNWSDEDFVAIWDSREYHFPAQSTSQLIIPNHSALEIQHIRKKFAKDLAEREFFKSKEYKTRFLAQERNQDGTPRLNSIHQGGTYSLDTLTPLIQKALTPLTEAKVSVRPHDKVDIVGSLSRNEEGELNTVAVDQKTSLRKKALEA